MGLSKIQMDALVDDIQYILNNPVKQIEWEKISQQFAKLLDQNIEYDEEEIQYILQKIHLPEDIDVTSLYVIADKLLLDYKVHNNLKLQMVDFEKDNKDIVLLLQRLKFPNVNNKILSYERDHWFLMDEFEKLLENGINYNIDDIRDWLFYNKSNSGLENNVIENIVKIAEFMQIYHNKPNTK